MRDYAYVQITCPDTGQPIMVPRATRNDPIAQLFVTGQITDHQRRAAEAYGADIEATSGRLRGPSRGPADVTWRGHRPGSDRLNKPTQRLARANKALGPSGMAALTTRQAGRCVRPVPTPWSNINDPHPHAFRL